MKKSRRKRKQIPVPRAVRDKVNSIFSNYSTRPTDKLSPNESRIFVRDLALMHMSTCDASRIAELMKIVDK